MIPKKQVLEILQGLKKEIARQEHSAEFLRGAQVALNCMEAEIRQATH